MSATSVRARLHIASYILIAILVLLILLVFPKWTVDDAYIIFRYAENLVQHGQLTFNVGEDPVEGYTGMLLPLIIAAALELGISPSIAAHLVGVVSLLLSMLILYRLMLRFRIPGPIRISSFLIVATAGFVYPHVYSGMETWLFTALLLGASLQLHNLLRTGSISFGSHIYLAVTLLCLSLCRPEGIAYAMIAAGFLIVVSIVTSRSLSPTFAYALALGLPLLIYFIWRWNYYGYPLPNTY